jgi:hypothetical protein
MKGLDRNEEATAHRGSRHLQPRRFHTACVNDIAQAFAGHLGEVAHASIPIP